MCMSNILGVIYTIYTIDVDMNSFLGAYYSPTCVAPLKGNR